MMEINYGHIKQIIDEWDPIGLLAMHCPSDEYDLESKSITELYLEKMTAQELGKVIYEIFSESFGKDAFIEDLNECVNIAEKIKSMRLLLHFPNQTSKQP